MIKRLVVIFSFLLVTGLILPARAFAQETVQTCTQVTQYGGAIAYICGTETHVPVNTGLGDNLALIGLLTLGASGFLLFLSKKTKQIKLDGNE